MFLYCSVFAESSHTVPKIFRNIGIKTEPVMVGADATVYGMFRWCQIYACTLYKPDIHCCNSSRRERLGVCAEIQFILGKVLITDGSIFTKQAESLCRCNSLQYVRYLCQILYTIQYAFASQTYSIYLCNRFCRDGVVLYAKIEIF